MEEILALIGKNTVTLPTGVIDTCRLLLLFDPTFNKCADYNWLAK